MYTVQKARKEIENFRNLYIDGQYNKKMSYGPDADAFRLEIVIENYPDMIDEVGHLVLEAVRKTGFHFGFSPRLKSKTSAKKLLNLYKKEIFAQNNTPLVLYSIYLSSSFLLDKHPDLVDEAFAIFKDGLKSDKNTGSSLAYLYLDCLSHSIKLKPNLSKDEELLYLIENMLKKSQDNDRSLGFCYMLLGDIVRHNPAAAEKVIQVINIGLKSSKNDSWAIPRAYFCLKDLIELRKDLISKIVSCAANVPTDNAKQDTYFNGSGACGQVFVDIIKECPEFIGTAFKNMQHELKHVHRFGNGVEAEIWIALDNQLDKKTKLMKDISVVLCTMLKNDLSNGDVPYVYSRFESAVLKLAPKYMAGILEQLINGVKLKPYNEFSSPSETCLGTIHEILKKDIDYAGKVLDGMIVVARSKKFSDREVDILADIMIEIARYKPKFMQKIAILVNKIWPSIPKSKRDILNSLARAYKSADILKAKEDSMKKEIAKVNKIMKYDKAASELRMGKTGDTRTGRVEAKHKEAAKVQLDIFKRFSRGKD